MTALGHATYSEDPGVEKILKLFETYDDFIEEDIIQAGKAECYESVEEASLALQDIFVPRLKVCSNQ